MSLDGCTQRSFKQAAPATDLQSLVKTNKQTNKLMKDLEASEPAASEC